VLDLGIYIIISALIGAKLLLVITDFQTFKNDPRELLTSYLMLRERPELARSIRADGRATAKRFAWPRVLEGYEYIWETAFALTT